MKFFHESTWGVIGLEMEGSYYQKAIQSASKIRKSVPHDIKSQICLTMHRIIHWKQEVFCFRGVLGTTGVKPTYLITIKIL